MTNIPYRQSAWILHRRMASQRPLLRLQMLQGLRTPQKMGHLWGQNHPGLVFGGEPQTRGHRQKRRRIIWTCGRTKNHDNQVSLWIQVQFDGIWLLQPYYTSSWLCWFNHPFILLWAYTSNRTNKSITHYLGNYITYKYSHYSSIVLLLQKIKILFKLRFRNLNFRAKNTIIKDWLNDQKFEFSRTMKLNAKFEFLGC